jgi:DNA-binding transcriptional MocR family regulator
VICDLLYVEISMSDLFPNTQMLQRPGIIDLAWGHPSPTLLPLAELQRAAVSMIERRGAAALAYGAEQGAGPLLAWLHERISRIEGRALAPDEITTTAGNSDALDQICALWTKPGDVVLVETPTYHLAVRIMRDHPLDLVPVTADEFGLRIDALAETIARLRGAGRRPRMLYLVPTLNNPTGASLSTERRAALVEMAATEDFLIVEDDVYRELSYDGPAPPSLWSLAESGVVARLGSFAKTLAPGLRVGWLTGGRGLVRRLVESGLRDSGGGVNHFAAMVAAEFSAEGRFETHVAGLRAAYQARRDALLAGLAARLPAGCGVRVPAGGYFIWVTLPDGLDAKALLPHAEAQGVSYLPGSRFHLDGGGASALRLAFSYYSEQELIEAARRLAAALTGALTR